MSAEHSTVSELIAKLATFDPDAAVWHQSTGGVIDEVSIDRVNVADKHDVEYVGAGSVVIW